MADWHSEGFGEDDVQGFLDACDSLLEDLDDLPERAEDFAESVRDKVTGMRDWAEENQRVTPTMRDAVENMGAGVAKWKR